MSVRLDVSIPDFLVKLSSFSRALLFGAAGLSIGMALYIVIGPYNSGNNVIDTTLAQMTREQERTEARTKILAEEQRELAISAANKGPTPSPASPTQAATAQLNARIDDLSTRESKLENALVQSPEKALELPLLSRDISDLKAQVARDELDFDKRVDQVYDLSKFLIGGIFFLLLAAVSQSLVRVWQRASKDKDQAESV